MTDIEKAAAPLTDMTNHRIQGYLPGGAAINLPLWSHVQGNLWQGGCIGGVKLPDGFRTVLSLYPWERYQVGPDTEVREVKMYDDLEQGLEQVDELADWVNMRCVFGPTLVHCQAGINRSALVTATALIRGGMKPGDAVELLRVKRSPLVLANRHFLHHLVGQETRAAREYIGDNDHEKGGFFDDF